MKRLIIIVITIALFLTVTGCNSKAGLPDNPIVFQAKEYTDYRSIVSEDKEYVPYCSVEPESIGDCLGYFEESGVTIYVCELKEQASDDWLAITPNLGNRNEGMAFRRTSVIVIPEGLESEPGYYWND